MQRSKESSQRISSAAGIQIDLSDEQSEKALGSRETLQFGWNVTLQSEEHVAKQYEPMISTEDGMQIDLSDEQYEKARSSIRISLGLDSSVTLERELQ
jgi:hypothetical protein